MSYDDKESPSLVGFLNWLRSGTREIKRDMEHGRDEVRVLTVHGAKGLEAPIVFLPDTMAANAPARDPLIQVAAPGFAGDPRLCVWRLREPHALKPWRTPKPTAARPSRRNSIGCSMSL